MMTAGEETFDPVVSLITPSSTSGGVCVDGL